MDKSNKKRFINDMINNDNIDKIIKEKQIYLSIESFKISIL
jgi:hypothetical protein